MKHFFTFLLTLVVTLGWAQKKELKQAQKLYKSAKISEAKASLDANQALLELAELKYAAPYNLLRSQITLAEEAYQASYDYLQLAQKHLIQIIFILGFGVMKKSKDEINSI